MRHVLLMTAMAVAVTAALPLSARERDRDRDDVIRITPNQIVDMADARIAQLKADLRLTPDQDRNWSSFQNALHDMAQRRADRMTKVREARSAQTDPAAPTATAPAATAPVAAAPADPNARPLDDRDMRARSDRDDRDRAPDLVADMRNRADMMSARADEFRKFADASGPLYNSLDDRQKRRFLAFVQINMMDDPMMVPPPPRRGRDRDRW